MDLLSAYDLIRLRQVITDMKAEVKQHRSMIARKERRIKMMESIISKKEKERDDRINKKLVE